MTRPGLLCHKLSVAYCDAVELSLVKTFYENGTDIELRWGCFIAEKGTTKKEITAMFKHAVNETDGKLIILDQSFFYLTPEEINGLLKGDYCIAYCFMHVLLLILNDMSQSKLKFAFNEYIEYLLDVVDIKKKIEALASCNIRVWGLKILSDLAYLINLDLDIQYSAWRKLCDSRIISLICYALENAHEWKLNLTEEESFVIGKFFSLLQALVELTNLVEGIEIDAEARLIDELLEVWRKLSLLEFKSDIKQAREHPTVNLRKSIDVFEKINASFPQITLKDFTILMHYRVRGELRAMSNGLVPEGQFTLDCLTKFAGHGVETASTFTGYGTGPLVINRTRKNFVLLERPIEDEFDDRDCTEEDIDEAESLKTNDLLDLEGLPTNTLAEMIRVIKTAKKHPGRFVSLSPSMPECLLKYFPFVCDIYN